MERDKLDQSMGGKFKVDQRGPYTVDVQTGLKFRPLDIHHNRLVFLNDTLLQQRKAARTFEPKGGERLYSPIFNYEGTDTTRS